jgi:hypothetical protein
MRRAGHFGFYPHTCLDGDMVDKTGICKPYIGWGKRLISEY